MADGASVAAMILASAHGYVGNSYLWGGSQPGGFDCSGLVQYVYGRAGISLPRTTWDQVNQGIAVDPTKAAPGDLVFFDETGADTPGPGGNEWSHVGIYLGNGQMISASNPSTGVQITSVAGFSPVGKYQFRRVIPNYAGTGDTGMTAGATSALTGSTDSSWDANSIAASVGLSGSLFDSDPELKNVLAEATSEGLDPSTAVGQARFTAMLQATNWYKTKTDQQRKWAELGTSDPAEARQQFISSLGTVIHAAAAQGVTLSTNQEWTLASQNASLGWTADELNFSIAANLKTTANGMYNGNAGKIADNIHQQAAAYGYPISAAGVGYATYQILNGHADPEDVTTNMKTYAKGLFPGAAAAIDAGKTLADVAQPYLALNQSVLEQNPDSIDLSKDAKLRAALGYQAPPALGAKPPAAGTPAPAPTMMPLWQYEQALKDDPRWLGTDNAQQSITSAGTGVLKDFGLSAVGSGAATGGSSG